MKKLTDFDIPFSGLKIGNHRYDFKIGKSFFDLFEYCEIEDGDFDVRIDMEKQASMLILDFDLKGKVNTECDRCGSEVAIPVVFRERIFVKFGDEVSDDEHILIIPEHAHQVNVATLIEEFAVLSLPVRRIHPEGECNRAALQRLKELEHQEHTGTDPRWDKLKGLIK